MENSKFMSCDIERDLLCISFHVYQIILSLCNLAIPLNIHDTTGKGNKREKKKKRLCTKKRGSRVTSGSFSTRLHRAIK